MELLNTFLPYDRRHAILNQVDIPEKTTGAALFLDISGYSTITTTLAHTLGSQRGSEVMTYQLNQLYNVLIDWVHAYQGSVIVYGGDSLICWFDDHFGIQDGYIFNGAERAVSCGLQMQSSLKTQDQESNPNSYPFKIKISIMAGEVNRLLVGDPNIQYFEVIAGKLVDRLSDAEQLIDKDEIIVGPEVLTAVHQELKVIEWRTDAHQKPFAVISNDNPTISPSPWVFKPTIQDSITQQWVQNDIYQRLNDKSQDFIAELRPTVTLFMSFTGIEFDKDHLAKIKLNKYVKWLQRVIYQQNGIFVHLTIGDKGSYCFAIFESGFTQDDTINALKTALILLETPSEMSFIENVKIGITTGVLYAGTYGSDQRHTFSVQGQETNLAARLMQHAMPGEILVSARISNRAKAHFHFVKIATITLKGFIKPIPIYSVHTNKKSQPDVDKSYKNSAQTFIGRTKELDILQQNLLLFKKGELRVVYIEGKAGSGKSTLLSNFQASLEAQQMSWWIGQGNIINQDTPYFAWQEIIFQLFGLEDEDSEAIIERKIISKLFSVAQSNEYASLFNHICGVNFPETVRTQELTSEARAHYLETFLLQLLQEYVSNEEIILIFEDAHWLDSASWRLIHKVLTSSTKLYLIILSRPTNKNQTYSSELGLLNQFPFLELLQLHAFAENETEILLAHCLNVTAVPNEIVEFIHKLGQGNPFFTLEMAYALQESGYLVVKNGRCHIAKSISQIQSQFPESIQGIITNRLNHLSADQAFVLKIASVVGEQINYSLLENIFSNFQNSDQLPFLIDNLLNLNFISPSSKASGAYEFKHHLIQEAIYSVLTFSQRQQLHQSVAEWIEENEAVSANNHFETLAYHWEKAEKIEKGVKYLQLAGEKAWRQFAHDEVISNFKKVLALTTGQGIHISKIDRAKISILIGRAFVFKTNYQEGRYYLENGLDQLNLPHLAYSSSMAQFWHLAKSLGLLFINQAIPAAFRKSKQKESQRLQLASQAFLRLIEIYYHSNEVLLSTLSSIRAYNLAGQIGNSPELAEASAIIGSFFSFLRMDKIARKYYLQSLKISRTIKSQEALSFTILVKTTFDLGKGAWKNAEHNIQNLLNLNQKSGDQRRVLDAQQLLTLQYLLLGDFQMAINAGEKLVELATLENDTRFLGHGFFAIAYCRYQMNGPGAALVYMDDLKEVILSEQSQLIDKQLLFNTLALIATILLEIEDNKQAVVYADKAIKLTNGTFQSSFYTLPGYTLLTDTFIELQKEGLKNATETEDLLNRFKQYANTFPIGKPAYLLMQGIFEHASNPKGKKPFQRWAKGMQLAQRLRLTPTEGYLQYQSGMLTNCEPKLQKAKSIFKSHLMKPALQQAESQLKKLSSPT